MLTQRLGVRKVRYLCLRCWKLPFRPVRQLGHTSQCAKNQRHIAFTDHNLTTYNDTTRQPITWSAAPGYSSLNLLAMPRLYLQRKAPWFMSKKSLFRWL